ncbi:MAG: hypothetical protein IIU59_03685, partial [Alistipes sp.]|nr:hypothetical protein [Alistipes sp.]
MLIYDFCIALYSGLLSVVALWNKKAKQWVAGRKNIFERMSAAIASSDRVVWIHVASLGEFEQGRPIIEEIRRQHPEYKILLTFFSPSGYEIRKNYDGADYIFYLPADTLSNVKNYIYKDAFAAIGIAIDDPDLATKLDAYLSENEAAAIKLCTDANGMASCADLPLGLYFVRQTNAVEGFAPCTPFLVTVPMESTDGYVYAVNASPKTEVAKLTSITIQKVWNTDASTKAAD